MSNKNETVIVAKDIVKSVIENDEECIDLSKIKYLIIYSQDFSTARHTQRRARQANREREDEIKVHFLLVKNALSDQVYESVSINKINFVDSVYKKVAI